MLARIGRLPGQDGTTRPGLGAAEQQACELVASWLEEEGLAVSWDAAGNLFGRLPGSDPTAPEIWTGSHLDTVPNGGRFDGALGVLVALEAVAGLTNTVRLSTLCVVVFRDEEGWRFGRGFFGSRAVCGEVVPSDLVATDGDGVAVGEALSALGFAGTPLPSPLPGSFVEVHIEQGPVLEQAGMPHAVVSAISGMAGFSVTLRGVSGHAGTVPLADRQDAFVAGAEFALQLRDEALRIPGAVATIGEVHITDAASNVVPGLVRLSVDLRAPTSEALAALADAVARIARSAECSVGVEQTWYSEPVPLSDRVRRVIHEAAAALDVQAIDLPSGAGHDAGILATAGVATGMLLVRSMNGGVSHGPEELTDRTDVATAIAVLAGTLRTLSEPLSSG